MSDDFDSALAVARADHHLVQRLAEQLMQSDSQVNRVVLMHEAFRAGDDTLAMLYARNLSDDLGRSISEHVRTCLRVKQAIDKTGD